MAPTSTDLIGQACNTTYTYLVMKDGNSFTQGSLSAQKGWFKVVFVALDATGKPTGKEVEYYLANFDSSKDAESGPYTVEFAIFRCTLNWLLWNFDFISGCIGQVNLGALVIGCSRIIV